MPTKTPVTTPTEEPPPAFCWTLQRKFKVLKQVLRRLGSEEGERRYQARYDLDHDGDIDWRDVEIIFVDIPTCPHRHGRHDWNW
jgi:hypothetical protein